MSMWKNRGAHFLASRKGKERKGVVGVKEERMQIQDQDKSFPDIFLVMPSNYEFIIMGSFPNVRRLTLTKSRHKQDS